jgi:hypothetical protein
MQKRRLKTLQKRRLKTLQKRRLKTLQKRRLKTLQKRRKNGALFFLVFKAPQNGDVGVIFF